MKRLCFKLVSIIPDHHFNPPKEFLSQQDQLERAAGYIKLLKERVEGLRATKTQLLMNSADAIASNYPKNNAATSKSGSKLSIVRIRELNSSSLEVVLITGISKNFMLHQVISILEQEGLEVVTVSLSNNGDRIFHTLHAQVKISRIGVDTPRVCERIHELISLTL